MQSTVDAGPTDDELRAALDLRRLEAFEGALSDAAEALEQVERIRRSDLSPTERAAAIRALGDDQRFDIGSDLVRNGDLSALEQVQPVPERDPIAIHVDPSTPQIGDSIEG